MSESAQRPQIVESESVEMETVEAGEGMSKAVLIGPDDGPNFAMRRFELAPGARVPKHTNEVEHEQYVLQGEYTVGFREDGEDTEYTVSEGDALLIPAGVVHWYRNESDDSEARSVRESPRESRSPSEARGASEDASENSSGNEPREIGAFICVVPNGDDTIQVIDEE